MINHIMSFAMLVDEMSDDDISVGNSFDFRINVDGLTFKEKLNLCSIFDSYEVEHDIGDFLIVDVISFDQTEIILRVTLKKGLTYEEIDMYLDDMLTYADSSFGGTMKMTPSLDSKPSISTKS